MVETLTTNEVISILLAIGLLLLFSTTLGGIFEKYNLPKKLKRRSFFRRSQKN